MLMPHRALTSLVMTGPPKELVMAILRALPIEVTSKSVPRSVAVDVGSFLIIHLAGGFCLTPEYFQGWSPCDHELFCEAVEHAIWLQSEPAITALLRGCHQSLARPVQFQAEPKIEDAARELNRIFPLLKRLFLLFRHTEYHSLASLRDLWLYLHWRAVGYLYLKPSERPGWACRSRRCDSPQCVDCDALEAFLIDPGRQQWNYKTGEKRRRHLICLLPTELFTVDEPIMNPAAKYPQRCLRVVKLAGKEYDLQNRCWLEAGAKVSEACKQMEGEFLEKLLGPQYGPLVLLQGVSLPSDLAGHHGSSVSTEPTRQYGEPYQVAGSKRPADEGLESTRRAPGRPVVITID